MDKRVQIGGYEYMSEINRGVMALNEANTALNRIVEERPGLAVMMVLVAKAALRLTTIRDALENLREIGQYEAERRKREKKRKSPSNPGQGRNAGASDEQAR